MGQAKEGTAPYTYQVVPAGSPVVAADWVSTNTFTRAGSSVGIDYDVHTKDAYGCDKFVTVKVFKMHHQLFIFQHQFVIMVLRLL